MYQYLFMLFVRQLEKKQLSLVRKINKIQTLVLKLIMGIYCIYFLSGHTKKRHAQN